MTKLSGLKRVVVTGIGMVSPLGSSTDICWTRLINGDSGITKLPPELFGDTPIKIGGLVPSFLDDPIGGLDLDKIITPKDQRKSDRFIHLALTAAAEAIEQSGISSFANHEKLTIATIIATGIGGFLSITDAVKTVEVKGSKRLSPFTVPSFIANLAAAQISIKYGLKGIMGAPVTACAASIQSIGDGLRIIKSGEANVAVVGGSEACINSTSLGSFNAAKALSSNFNDAPSLASRPFDAARSGFVMSEGAGVLVLEELSHALDRNAPILAEVKGYGSSSDAWHITSGPDDGEGAARAMELALSQSLLLPKDIDYINAHSTSTVVGDNAEIAAIKTVFNQHKPYISSTKSSTGHMLGAAGAIASIFSIKALNESKLPPSLNIDNIDESAKELNIIKNHCIHQAIDTALVNGFGFGGVNASIIFSRFNE